MQSGAGGAATSFGSRWVLSSTRTDSLRDWPSHCTLRLLSGRLLTAIVPRLCRAAEARSCRTAYTPVHVHANGHARFSSITFTTSEKPRTSTHLMLLAILLHRCV